MRHVATTQIDDYATVAAVVSSAFFVVVAFGLLFRYRQVSQKINASSDLGRDLWGALDQRLRKQDERILDMMGRVEVLQSRVVAGTVIAPAAPAAVAPPTTTEATRRPAEVVDRRRPGLDETQKAAIRLLSEMARSTVEIKAALGRSREHTARLMKGLFDRGLVIRDDSKKPFVYQLTEAGRRYLSAS